jgi:hypothetical protein
LFASLLVSTHAVPHIVLGELQVDITTHMPPVQFDPGAQMLPHMPQLVGSERTFTHDGPQVTLGGGHGVPQTPPVQLALRGHCTPHPPQFWGSLSVFVQPVPQSVCPVGHIVPLQIPIAQIWPLAHTRLQPPQLFGSLSTSVHIPLH